MGGVVTSSHASETAANSAMHGRRVLVVDDDRVHCAMLRHIIEEMGAQVLVANSGEEGIRIFEEHRPAIVLMDLHMPGMDGLEAAWRIKDASGDELVTIIFITGSDDDRTLVRCLESGGDDFVTKPLNQAVLRARLQSTERARVLWDEVKRRNAELRAYHALAERDKEIASELFSRLLARSDFALKGVRSSVSPMDQLSGDVVAMKRTPGGHTHVLIADFTGHGLSAAVCGMPVFDLFHTMTEKGCSLEIIVEELNDKLCRALPPGLFCACVLIRVDPESRRAFLWNAGMPDVALRSAGGGVRATLRSRSLPLGILPREEFDFTLASIEFEEGDRLYVCSDGVTECANPDGVQYGDERYREHLGAAGEDAEVFDSLLRKLENWRCGLAQSDDVTLVEVDLTTTCTAAIEATSSALKEEHEDNPEFLDLDAVPGSESSAQESEGAGTRTHRVGKSWEVSFRFEADSLRGFDPVPVIMSALMEIQGLNEHRSELFTVLTELFVNALDHGVLELDSAIKADPAGFARYFELRQERLEALEDGTVVISLRHDPRGNGGRLVIRVKDSGAGFDPSTVPEPDPEAALMSGRGLMLVRSLCTDLRHNAVGNCAYATFDWS